MMKNKKILIVDDDIDLLDMLDLYLTAKGLDIVKVHDICRMPADFSEIDLIVLDINFPQKDGFELCRAIRHHWNMPILFLSARNNEADKIKGLMLGGDDYITKPFSLEELYARIYTNIQRKDRTEATEANETTISADAVILQKGICKIRGVQVDLTKSEYEIVELLFTHPKQIFSKERIYDLLWGYERLGNPQVVAEHVRNIRNKFAKVSSKEFIETHWGMGYTWIG